MSVKDAKTNFIRVGQYNATVGVAKAKRNKTEKRFTDDQMKRKFPLKPSQCMSTHGGAGYSIGSFWDNGAIVCGACGTRRENPPPTGGHNGIPTYPSFIRGIPLDKTNDGLRWMKESRRKWWQFWK